MTTFPFEFERRFLTILKLTTGATPENSSVGIEEQRLRADFGRFHFRTPLSNVKDVRITRDYQWWKAIGARGSLADRGATYGTTTRGGVCVCFHETVSALPGFDSPGLTLTVEDLDGFATAVREAAGLPA